MPLRCPGDSLSDMTVGQKRKDKNHVDRQARRVQIGIPISGDPGPYRFAQRGTFLGIIPAIVTTAITAASGTTPGSGNAQPYYLSTPDATSCTADSDNTSLAVCNWYLNSGTIAIGTHIWLAVYSNAYWYLGGDC